MKIKFPAYILAAIVGIFTIACNDDDSSGEYVVDESTGYSVIVNSFSLSEDESVLENLDSVFFSIDLDKGRIFNADSLPQGTKINRLVVKIGLPVLKEAKLLIPNAKPGVAADTVDYISNSTDSIDFSRGPVTLRLVSANGEVTRDYEISVNVHTVDPGLLAWSGTAKRALPTTLAAPTAVGVVDVAGEVVCFATDGSDATRATTENPYAADWDVSAAMLPAGADVVSATAVGATIYMLDNSGMLYASTDNGGTWSPTGTTMTHILGSNGSMLLGVSGSGANYRYVTYPATTETPVDADFPVANTSQSIEYTTKWSASPLTMIVGGTTADGRFTGATWAYTDGEWAKISKNPIPEIGGLTVIPYFTAKVSSQWVVTERTTLIAFGGINADGTINGSSYVSYDQGVNWEVAGTNLTLPDEVAGFYGAPAVVKLQTLPEELPTSAWSCVAPNRLAPGYTVAASSRATVPIETWECPFIYLFGGYDATGTLRSTLWRGVINRLAFKPLQ